MHPNLAWEGLDLIHLAGARDQFMAVVSMATKLRAAA